MVYNGEKSNHFERLQAMNVAKSINNSERGGKAKVSNMDKSKVKAEFEK